MQKINKNSSRAPFSAGKTQTTESRKSSVTFCTTKWEEKKLPLVVRIRITFFFKEKVQMGVASSAGNRTMCKTYMQAVHFNNFNNDQHKLPKAAQIIITNRAWERVGGLRPSLISSSKFKTVCFGNRYVLISSISGVPNTSPPVYRTLSVLSGSSSEWQRPQPCQPQNRWRNVFFSVQ